MLYGYRKLTITVLGMGIATCLLILNAIDQETFKWVFEATAVAYLAANTVKGFANSEKV